MLSFSPADISPSASPSGACAICARGSGARLFCLQARGLAGTLQEPLFAISCGQRASVFGGREPRTRSPLRKKDGGLSTWTLATSISISYVRRSKRQSMRGLLHAYVKYVDTASWSRAAILLAGIAAALVVDRSGGRLLPIVLQHHGHLPLFCSNPAVI